MNKKITSSIIIVFILVQLTGFSLGNIEDKNTTKSEPKQFNSYKHDYRLKMPERIDQNYFDRTFPGHSSFYINATINPENKTLNAKMILEFFNNDNITIENMYFHLYPNSYANESLIPRSDLPNLYPGGFDAGWISIESLTVEGIAANYTIQAVDNTVLNITLPKTIKPNSTCNFFIEFTERIPRTQRRYGWFEKEGKTVFSIANWIPMPAVYDSMDGWNLDYFNFIGDPFYSDTALFDVSIEVPSDYTLAATGNLTDIENVGTNRIYHWKTQLVRDFAFVCSKDYYVTSVQSRGVNVTYLYLDPQSRYSYEAQNWADSILSSFEDYFGEYPYEDLVVAETFLAYGGMEYPQIVFIRAGLSSPDIVVAHEIGHQWFYGIIGNDEIDQPWLDEGFASYSEYIFEKAYMGETTALTYLRSVRDTVNYYYRNGFRGKINQTTEELASDPQAYVLMAYYKMKMVIEMLRQTLGDSLFKEAMHYYYDHYKFQNAFGLDLVNSVTVATDTDYTWFFDQWLNKEYLPEYSMEILEVKQLEEGYNITIKITQTTDFKVLIPVAVESNYGGKIYKLWINDTQETYSLIYTGYPVSVSLDPEGRFLMQNDDITLYINHGTSTNHTSSGDNNTTNTTNKAVTFDAITALILLVTLPIFYGKKHRK